jgi:hypothetical protein
MTAVLALAVDAAALTAPPGRLACLALMRAAAWKRTQHAFEALKSSRMRLEGTGCRRPVLGSFFAFLVPLIAYASLIWACGASMRAVAPSIHPSMWSPFLWGGRSVTCACPMLRLDLDHLNPELRKSLKEWMNWLKDDIGFKGWRFDFVKGYAPRFVQEYIEATEFAKKFNVGEYWVDCKCAACLSVCLSVCQLGQLLTSRAPGSTSLACAHSARAQPVHASEGCILMANALPPSSVLPSSFSSGDGFLWRKHWPRLCMSACPSAHTRWNGSDLDYNQNEARQKMCDFIDASGGECTLFDFPTKGILQARGGRPRAQPTPPTEACCMLLLIGAGDDQISNSISGTR